MYKLFHKVLIYSYYLLFFSVPLVWLPSTSELFEFNKMIVVYILTTIIAAAWISKMVISKNFNFKKSPLDLFLIIFLGSMFISTILSIDFRTSFLGYYSRFNGGFLSLMCYSILYWGIVSNFNDHESKNLLRFTFLAGALSSIYGVAERLGIDKDIWVQDVQHRVFSTFGQPNWMAAWLVAMIPISVVFSIRNEVNFNNKHSKLLLNLFYFALPQLFLMVLLFTRSRSGILAYAASIVFFWISYIIICLLNKTKIRKVVRNIFIHNIIALFLILFFGTPWTPTIQSLLNKTTAEVPVQTNEVAEQKVQGPILEVGGSSSAEIRKIVWTGAFNLWKKYPVFGTGLETFAFSYYETRPAEHNMVSEWDFLYNKAHNEYLNYMSTTGSTGIVSLASLTLIAIYIMSKLVIKIPFLPKNNKTLSIHFDYKENSTVYSIALLSGFVSIIITNFIGFSVVPVNLLFFTFPAIAFVMDNKNENDFNSNKFNKLPLYLVWGLSLLLVYKITNYWRADYYYANADKFNSAGLLEKAYQNIDKAIELSPNEAIFQDKKSNIVATIAKYLFENGNPDQANKLAESAMLINKKAMDLSPRNVNILRSRAKIAITLSEINPKYIFDAENVLNYAISYAPTEAKLIQNLGLVYFRMDEKDKAIDTLTKAIDLKPDYYQARYALAAVYHEYNEDDKAIEQLHFILNNILPEDSNSKELLKTIESPDE